jgi:putative alpha-1,2-mannosidase
LTKARDIADFKFENIVDTGTEGTKVALGTTAQRGSTTGQWRYNSETGFFEGRNTDGTFSTLQPDPVVTSVDDGEVDSAGGGNQTIVVTGQNFTTGGTIAFVGTSAEFNATTTTFNSSTQVTAVAPKASFLNAQEPYKVKFTSASGK